jgi:hypothetical protein
MSGFNKWDKSDGYYLATFAEELKKAAKVYNPNIKLQAAISGDPKKMGFDGTAYEGSTSFDITKV